MTTPLTLYGYIAHNHHMITLRALECMSSGTFNRNVFIFLSMHSCIVFCCFGKSYIKCLRRLILQASFAFLRASLTLTPKKANPLKGGLTTDMHTYTTLKRVIRNTQITPEGQTNSGVHSAGALQHTQFGPPLHHGKPPRISL